MDPVWGPGEVGKLSGFDRHWPAPVGLLQMLNTVFLSTWRMYGNVHPPFFRSETLWLDETFEQFIWV